MKSRLDGRAVRRMDCRKRAGMEAKGMERKWTTDGVWEGIRPVRGPRWGCVNVWGVKSAMAVKG